MHYNLLEVVSDSFDEPLREMPFREIIEAGRAQCQKIYGAANSPPPTPPAPAPAPAPALLPPPSCHPPRPRRTW
jgi:hypothetical protein